jgi:hypothetical protein
MTQWTISVKNCFGVCQRPNDQVEGAKSPQEYMDKYTGAVVSTLRKIVTPLAKNALVSQN